MSLNETRNSVQTVTKSRRSPLRRALVASAALAVLVGMMFATPKSVNAADPVPEIDASSMAGALTLLVGGVLALTDRARRS